MVRRSLAAVLAAAPLALLACAEPGGTASTAADTARDTAAADPHVAAASPVAAGAYLVRIAGCNDCHTAGWLQQAGDVPRESWLQGWRVGFRGPWGTTYPNNLRRTVRRMSEDEWVEMLRTRETKPPMPWFNVHAMSERDMRAIYRFIGTLGAPGDSVPAPLPPGQRPETPYYEFVPKTPGGS